MASNIDESVRRAWLNHLECRTATDDDNFFRQGGTSLQAAAMMADLSRLLGKRLRMRLLMANPSLIQLTRAVATELAADQHNDNL